MPDALQYTKVYATYYRFEFNWIVLWSLSCWWFTGKWKITKVISNIYVQNFMRKQININFFSGTFSERGDILISCHLPLRIMISIKLGGKSAWAKPCKLKF